METVQSWLRLRLIFLMCPGLKFDQMNLATTRNLTNTSIRMANAPLKILDSKYSALIFCISSFFKKKPFFRLYKSILVVVERNHQGSYDDFLCLLLQTSEDVIKQTKQNCLGFFQDQASLFAQIVKLSPPTPMLECLKAYLPKGGEEDEDLQEEKPEFPTVNKLIQELVLIQKLLSNKP